MEQTTLGPIQPHTEAKHDILRRHLSAWFPILGRSFPRLQYIDGFAGPGEYEGGEPGSPIIALNVIAQHPFASDYFQSQKQFDFLFVEENRTFYDHLASQVKAVRWPNSFNIQAKHGEFENEMTQLLDEVDSRHRTYPPTLLFIDPFGSAGFSMKLISRLAHYPTTDVLINFNYIDMMRWLLPDPAKHVTLDRLYGGDRWREALTLSENLRGDFLTSEYGRALGDAGWRWTNFEMVNRQNQTQYFLFFATRDPKGLEVIKGAMRRVSPDGLFRYTDRTDPSQLRLMGMDMDQAYAEDIAAFLTVNCSGDEVATDDLMEDLVAWHPVWLLKDLRAGLKLLENSIPSKIIEVRNGNGRPRRKGSFPQGSIIKFAS